MNELPSKSLRVQSLAAQGTEDDLQDTTVAQRIEMMWQLAVDAWTFKGELVLESRLPRDVVRLERGRR